MDIIATIFQIVLNAVSADQTGKLTDEFNAAVEEQINAGLSAIEAQHRTAMDMFDTSPDLQGARDIFEEQYHEMPARMRKEYDIVINGYRDDRAKFEAELATVGQGFAQRESDIMGLLKDQGRQARKDIEKTYSQAEAGVQSRLVGQGLSGSGVGASISGGFASQKADSIARLNEQLAAQKADYWSGLSGDRLAFGERAAGSGFGAGQDIGSARERALLNAYGAEQTAATNLADFNTGTFDRALGQMNKSSDRYIDFIEGINHVPPDDNINAFNAGMEELGTKLGRGNR